MKNDSLEMWKELVYYVESTGKLHWKERGEYHHPLNFTRKKNWNLTYANKIAGTVNHNDYVEIRYHTGKYRIAGHRLVWGLFYGVIPNEMIDHINGIRNDNRIENLRLASFSINNRNKIANSNTGERNISKTSFAYNVRIRDLNGNRKHIGSFKTLEEAIIARDFHESKNGY